MIRAFRDRTEAGRRLAEQFAAYRGSDALVLGIPRGGVIVAAVLAEELGLECDVLVSHKLGAPGNPEMAVGAVAEGGIVLLSSDATALGISPAYLNEELARQQQEVARRAAYFRQGRPFPKLEGRTAILVDDGVATGLTTLAAVRAARRAGASRVIVATPVASPSALALLRQEADEVVCLLAPPGFLAVGMWYQEFEQVSDEEVLAALTQARRRWEEEQQRRAA